MENLPENNPYFQLFDLAAEGKSLKEPLSCQNGIEIDENNHVYLALGAKIQIISLRNIAIKKQYFKDTIDFLKLYFYLTIKLTFTIPLLNQPSKNKPTRS
jgi:hypothetical protein